MESGKQQQEVFGRYVLERRLAVGGMAEIFLARHEGPAGFKRSLVIKRILPSYADDEQFMQMFLDEAKLAAHLSHPNIVPIYEFGQASGTYFIAMEFVRGPDLKQLLYAAQQAGGLPYPIQAKIIASCAEALEYAHTLVDDSGKALGIVHRDVSPSNVIVSHTGVPRLLDFGIAKAVGSVHKTQTGILKGKVPYMPPEQLMGRPVDRRTDVYALGVVLYELATGQLPFVGDSDFHLMRQICDSQSKRPRELRPAIPAELDAIITKAMARDPNGRFATARKLSAALEKFIVHQGNPVTSFDIAEYLKKLEKQLGAKLGFSSAPRSRPSFKVPSPPEDEFEVDIEAELPGGKPPAPAEDEFGGTTEVIESPYAEAISEMDPQTITADGAWSNEDSDWDEKTILDAGAAQRVLDEARAKAFDVGTTVELDIADDVMSVTTRDLADDVMSVNTGDVLELSSVDAMMEESRASQSLSNVAKAQPKTRSSKRSKGSLAALTAVALGFAAAAVWVVTSWEDRESAKVPPASTGAVVAAEDDMGLDSQVAPASDTGSIPVEDSKNIPEGSIDNADAGDAADADDAADAHDIADADDAADADDTDADDTAAADDSRPSKTSPTARSQKVIASNGTLILDTQPWTEVYFKGKPLGMTPLRTEMPTGNHRLLLKNPEERIETTLRVRIKGGATTTKQYKIKPGALALSVLPWGEVYINGKSHGVTPLSPIALSPGKHMVEVVHSQSGKKLKKTVQINSGATLRLKIDLTQ